ncbi:MAG: hypothetical protein ACRYGA_00545 [Janthinobacterium lividum]
MDTTEGTTFADVERLAHHAGMQLWDRPSPTRSGRYCVVRGRDILHHADDLEDAAGWIYSWVQHVH